MNRSAAASPAPAHDHPSRWRARGNERDGRSSPCARHLPCTRPAAGARKPPVRTRARRWTAGARRPLGAAAVRPRRGREESDAAPRGWRAGTKAAAERRAGRVHTAGWPPASARKNSKRQSTRTKGESDGPPRPRPGWARPCHHAIPYPNRPLPPRGRSILARQLNKAPWLAREDDDDGANGFEGND